VRQRNAAMIVVLVKPFQTPVLKRRDHCFRLTPTSNACQ
jgi:hypothetical protein